MTRGHPIIFSHPTLFLQVRSKANPLFEKILTYTLKYFSHSSVGKESACNARDLSSIPVSEDPLVKGQATHFSILGGPLWLSW